MFGSEVVVVVVDVVVVITVVVVVDVVVVVSFEVDTAFDGNLTNISNMKRNGGHIVVRCIVKWFNLIT